MSLHSTEEEESPRDLNVLPKPDEGGEYLKSFIYGGMDGIISVFVALGVASLTNLGNPKLILVLAFAKLISGSFSMGVGDWLGTLSFVQFARGERRREKWECDNYFEGEKEEMAEIFEKKGMTKEDAEKFIEHMATNQAAFLDLMMIHELGVSPDEEKQVAWKNGLVNFTAFILFSIPPIIPFIAYFIMFQKNSSYRNDIIFNSVSAGIFVLTLCLIGFLKARLSKTPIFKSVIPTLIAGIIAGVIGAASGYLLVHFLNISID